MEQLHSGAVSAELASSLNAVRVYLHSIADVLSRVSDADVLAELRELEVLRRRLAAVDHTLIAELDRRAIAGRLTMPTTSAVLQGLLRLSPHEAKRRVVAARACGPRHTLTGQPLPALRPALAAAQADGSVSTEHTEVILTTLNNLPTEVSVEDQALAEKHLVEAAAILRPREVAAVGRRILAHLHPDGALACEAEQHRRRGLTLLAETDGSYTVRGRLTATCGALLLATLTPRSAPQATDEAGPDPRSHPQRLHDALQDLAGVVVRRDELPDSGAPAQVIITMTADQLATRQGLAQTSFGQQLSVSEALALADEAAISLLLRDATGAVLAHGRAKRIATRTQTLALIARDGGCTFPGCDKPPEWCQRHHITAWADGGTTDLDNLTLVCGYHHREFTRGGWECRMADGQPRWIPPAWIDPTRTPRRNQRVNRQ
ncbi:MAG TPA: DUF222 domain-containing protein [Jatrophihabitans sp.]|jgi:hypothetical protein|uniref:HNH endonuclease signature motif containing protein n=1 Tax=Jatrophihabitans sp. TaxID=1932789 RepID=UPI002EFA0B5D